MSSAPPSARPVLKESDLSSAYRGREVWVTGANGFLGAALVRRLGALGARCSALHRPGSDLTRLRGVGAGVRLVAATLDGLRDRVRARPPKLVFHLAAYGVDPRQNDPAAAFRANVGGLASLLDALSGAGLEAFVNTGSCSEYSGGIDRALKETDPIGPRGPYAESKAAAVQLGVSLARTRGWPIVTLRPFTFYGPGERPDRLVPHVIRSLRAGEEIRMTGGAQTRDFIHVDDVVECYLRAALPPVAAGEIFNVGSGKSVTVRAMVEKIRALAGSSVPLLVGAIPYREHEMWHLRADIRKAKARLGWAPRIGLDEGLRGLLERA